MKKYLAPVLTGIFVIFLGSFVFTYFDIYQKFNHVDKVFHVTGGLIVAWFFSRLWAEKLRMFNRFERVIICIGMGAMIGFFWEILEYSTSFPPFVHIYLIRHYLYGGDLVDTLGDLMADVFGAAIFGLLAHRAK